MKIDYSHISKTYDHYRSFGRSEIGHLIRFGKISEGMKILDLGCGTGNLSTRLLDCLKVDLVGVDKSFPMLEKAREKALEVLCADADLFALPFKKESFDVVIMA